MTFGTKEGRSEVLYTLVGTATIMTIIEIAAAYLLVFPETAMAIDLGLKSLPKTATTYNIERIGLIEARQIIATARAREKQSCTGVVNKHSYVFAGSLVTMLIMLTFALRSNYYARLQQPIRGYMSPPLQAALLTVVCLVPFQGLFYYISKYLFLYADPFPMLAPVVLGACTGVTPESVQMAKSRVTTAVRDDYVSVQNVEKEVVKKSREALLELQDSEIAQRQDVQALKAAAAEALGGEAAAAVQEDVRELAGALPLRKNVLAGGPTIASLLK